MARKQAPDGTPAPPFQGFNGRVEAAARSGDAATMLRLLSARPGELARGFVIGGGWDGIRCWRLVYLP